jgi:NAD(P)-dependent dehydrogenase (short-subunit alcohol dehydrogenase family)
MEFPAVTACPARAIASRWDEISKPEQKSDRVVQRFVLGLHRSRRRGTLPFERTRGAGIPIAGLSSANGRRPMKRQGQPAELAPVYVLLVSQESSFVTGEVYGVTGGNHLT